MTYLISAAAAAVLLLAVLLLLARRHRADDVARFHRAREMTTAWSQAAQRLPAPDPEAHRELELEAR